MAATPQTYANHTRWHAPFHFFVVPVLLLNVFWSLVQLFRAPGWNEAEWALVSVALLVLAFLARINPLRAQDRIIRLEEQLRYQRLLPADLAARSAELTRGQIIALRFASDEELAELIARVLSKELQKAADIKKAIRQWRADTHRV
ncbi:MAG TPA: DUF6526 family protein [Pyrinomonadaceae bacterium]|nr:DUF6526 family protein [Pyrinomonadaceae bacterium]